MSHEPCAVARIMSARLRALQHEDVAQHLRQSSAEKCPRQLFRWRSSLVELTPRRCLVFQLGQHKTSQPNAITHCAISALCTAEGQFTDIDYGLLLLLLLLQQSSETSERRSKGNPQKSVKQRQEKLVKYLDGFDCLGRIFREKSNENCCIECS